MRPLLAFCVLLATACGSPKLSRSAGGLEIAASSLELPDAFVGYSSRSWLEIHSSARGVRTAAIAIAPPFTAASTAFEVGGGASVPLEIRFVPESEGPAQGTLRLTVDGEEVEVELRALARTPPRCELSDPCRASAFDPEQGLCLESTLPDGTACQPVNACIQSAVCISGECLGTPRSCDDGNVCTADACDAAGGCLHLDSTASCPAPQDPCKVPTCHPSSGCGIADAPDGTSCGPADCDTAKICLAGACRVVKVPEGTTCAPESPCQGKGVCKAQQCVRPAQTQLVPAWTYQVPDGAQLYFNGVADDQGSLYWAECRGTLGCELVSATGTGFLRFRVSLQGAARSGLEPAAAPGLLVLAGDLVVSAQSKTRLEARRTSDGTLAWAAELGGELTVADPDGVQGEVGPIVDDGHGSLYVVGRVLGGGCEPLPEWRGTRDRVVFSLSSLTGAVRWKRVVTGEIAALAADEAGSVYVSGSFRTDAGVHAGVLSLDSNGSERWRAQGFYGAGLAVAGQRVATAGSSGAALLFASDGGQVAPPAGDLPSISPFGVEPLLSPSAGYLIGQTESPCGHDGPCPMAIPRLGLHSFAPSDGARRWEAWLRQPGTGTGTYAPPPSLVDPALAANGDVLLALGPSPYFPDGTHSVLRALTSVGAERFSCELPGPGLYDAVAYAGAAVLQNGRWVVVAQEQCFSCIKPPLPELRAFDVPGYQLAASGWVTSGGSNKRSGRPR